MTSYRKGLPAVVSVVLILSIFSVMTPIGVIQKAGAQSSPEVAPFPLRYCYIHIFNGNQGVSCGAFDSLGGLHTLLACEEEKAREIEFNNVIPVTDCEPWLIDSNLSPARTLASYNEENGTNYVPPPELINDNCPTVANPNQSDVDSDGVGDVCDNAPNTYNPDQADTDEDGIPDVIDPDPNNPNPPGPTDSDNDNVPDNVDSCPSTPNLGIDRDTDGIDDACDTDLPPVANAGQDQTGKKEGNLVQLDGRASSDPENGPLQFTWEQIGGPQVLNPQGLTTSTPSFTMPSLKNSEYISTVTFKLTVTDNLGSMASDNVEIEYSCPVDVYADAFIPYKRVSNPNPTATHDPEGALMYHEFAGDDRTKPIKGGSARMWSSVIVDLCSGGELLSKSHDVGVSHAYYYITSPTGKKVELVDSAKTSTDLMFEDVQQTGLTVPVTTIHIMGKANFPFGLGMPYIDTDLYIHLTRKGDTVVYSIGPGLHDGFPAHSIFIGKNNVFFFSPIKSKTQPWDLLLTSPQWDVAKSCQLCQGTVQLNNAYAPIS